jgi:hypothetical protein
MAKRNRLSPHTGRSIVMVTRTMEKRIYQIIRCAQMVLLLLFFSSCQSVYYKTMESFGYHKRDLLVNSVEEARDSQEEAKEQFKSALERFSAVVNFQGGELEQKYNQLKSDYEASESKVNAVRERIDDVEDVAEALFEEWESELAQYSNDNLRRESKRKLQQTRQRYNRLITAMKSAESKFDPILATFKDQVLFLKHNLNSQAIASLDQELASVKVDIAALIREIEASIAEADSFIKAMNTEG